MAISFNETFYLEQKLAQLQEAGETSFETTADVQAAFDEAGLTAEAHYEAHGASEGLNPSADFDTNLYLTQKLAQLQALSGFEDITTTDELLAFFTENGFSPLEHYNQFGAGEALSPNANFNAQAYLEDKLALLQSEEATAEEWAGKTTEDLLAFFNENGLSPLDHFQQHGEVEGLVAKPVESTPGEGSGLTEALGNYQGAVAARTEFLNGNADNELLEDTAVIQGLAEGEEPTAAQVATAIEQADTAADAAVVTAEGNLQNAVDTLDVARATRVDAYVTTADFPAGVVAQDVNDAVSALDALSSTTLLRDATLENARVEAQADVEADEGVYAADGTVVVAADGTVDAGYTELALVNGEYVEATGDAEVVGYADVAAPVDASATADGNGAATVNVEANFTGTLALTFTPDNGSETTVELTIEDGTVTAGTTGAVTVNEAGDTVTVSGLTATTGVVATSYGYTEASLVDTFSAVELQQNIVDAEADVASFVAANGDNVALLDSVRDAINAHIGAGGANVDVVATTTTLLDVRTSIVNAIDGAEIDQATVDVLVDTVAGYDFAFVAAEGESLTAEQTAVNNAFADTEERVALDAAVTDAEEAFGVTNVGGVLNTILALQEQREGLIEAVATAETELADAQATAEATQALVDQLEALDTNIEEALATLQDSEEDGGFGVTLGEFGTDATAESDLYVFADDEGSTITIANFGAEGEDRLFFGEGYTLVQLEEGQSINNRVGSASELEIFWEETDTGLNLYVEAEAEAGRDLTTNAITTIELAGVTAEDIDFAAGVLSAGTVEVA